MERHLHCDKMILAVLQGDDYQLAIEELNKKGFYATVLHSSGGFLRKKSVTLMIGINHADLSEAIQILKHYGERTEIQPMTACYNPNMANLVPPLEVPIQCGGVVLFVINVEQNERY